MTTQTFEFQVDYSPFEFQGFGRPGYCFLRARGMRDDDDTLRIAFLCVQLENYHGTSITNAVEEILARALKRLIDEEKIPKKKKWLIAKKRAPNELLSHTRWIEHYPPGVGLGENGSYALVAFDEQLNPVWNYVSREEAQQECGVDSEFFKIKRASLIYGK
nr:hypothetical protein [uncultured Albidiferax sp.]